VRAQFSLGSLAASTAPGYSTAFPLTQNPISEGGAWANGGIDPPRTNVQTDGVHAFGTMSSFDGTNYPDSVALLTSTYPANQWVQGVIYNSGALSGLEVELLLRGTAGTTSFPYYELDWVYSSQELNLVINNGPDNSFTILATVTTNVNLSDSIVLYGQMVGTVITAKCGSNTVLTYDTAGDSVKLSSGTPGMGFWNETGSSANSTKFGLRSFSAGVI